MTRMINLRTGGLTTQARYIKRIEGVFESLMKYSKIDARDIQSREDLQKFLDSAKAKGSKTGGLARWIEKTDRYQEIIASNVDRERKITKGRFPTLVTGGNLFSTRSQKRAREEKGVWIKNKNYAWNYQTNKRVSARPFLKGRFTKKQK